MTKRPFFSARSAFKQSSVVSVVRLTNSMKPPEKYGCSMKKSLRSSVSCVFDMTLDTCEGQRRGDMKEQDSEIRQFYYQCAKRHRNS